jgi:hypothetical protein
MLHGEDPLEKLMISAIKRRGLTTISILSILIWGRAAIALGNEVVLPNSNEAVEGNSNSAFFHLTSSVGSDFKIQQVYDASEFGSAPTVITQIAFRPDGFLGDAFSPTTLRDFYVKLSTTSKSVDGLSSSFLENPGPDETVVFSSDLTISSSNIGSPPGFDILIDLAVPFMYDPNVGNLLLEMQNPSINNLTSTTGVDAVDTIGDSVSFIVGRVGGVTANFNFSLGMVTRFTTVPEPFSLVLFALGMSLTFGSRFRR